MTADEYMTFYAPILLESERYLDCIDGNGVIVKI